MSLRQEYNRSKIILQEVKKAEVKDWLNENVVFITERIDRVKIKRLINLMLKFDQKFGPFKDKIPGISSIVGDAENALQMALSGRLTDSKISEIFQRLSIIYALLSDFFANDLKLLLQTPAFKVPRSKPEIRLDSITDTGYSPKHITDTIVLTLTPSEEELAFLNKLYKGVTLPQLDRHNIANQMLGLSYKDLEGLCGIEQVPMAVVPDESLIKEQGFIQGLKNVLGGAAKGAAVGGAAGSVVPAVGTAVGAGVGAAVGGAKALYDFFRSPQVEAVKKTINDLQVTTNKLKIPSLTAAMKGFRNRLNTAMDKKAPTKTDTLVLSQAVVVAEFYKNIAEKLKELVNDPDAKTLSDWAENETDPGKKTITNDGKLPDASEEAQQALETLMTYLDSTVENLNPEGNLAKLKKSIASKFEIPNTQNTLPQEFTSAIPKIKQEIIEIILAESITLRESYGANKKNKFIEFDSEVNKILNESLASLQAIVNSFNTAARGVEKSAANGASAPSTPSRPSAGTGTNPATGAANDKSIDTTIDQIVNQGSAAQTITPEIRNGVLQAKGFVANINKLNLKDPFISDQINGLVKDIQAAGVTVNKLETAINIAATIATNQITQTPEKLSDLNKLTGEDLKNAGDLSAMISKNLKITGTLPEQMKTVSKLFGIVSKIPQIYVQLQLHQNRTAGGAPATPATPGGSPPPKE